MQRAMQPTATRLLGNATWLLRLRWVAVIGQLATIGVVSGVLNVRLPLAPLLGIIAVTAATNVAFALWLHVRRAHRDDGAIDQRVLAGWLVGLMALDLLSLTGLLYFSGGPANPFVMFYLVNVALAAMLLPEPWAWALTAMAVACLAALFLHHVPLDDLQRHSLVVRPLLPEPVRLGEVGAFCSLAGCALVVVYFVTRVARELRQREEQLRIAEQQRARAQRLEALGTLAAGAGHELSTPLSTIAVASKELARHLESVDVPDSVREDVALIRAEVDRCRNILDRMAGHMGQARAEQLVDVSLGKLIDAVLQPLAEAHRVKVQASAETCDRTLKLPLESVAQAVRGVVQNALDASPPAAPVVLSVELRASAVRLIVVDQGPGMSAEVLARAGEPFFTTKEPGKGMGLGLFLTRSVLERLGGSLQLESPPGGGVRATIELPLE